MLFLISQVHSHAFHPTVTVPGANRLFSLLLWENVENPNYTYSSLWVGLMQRVVYLIFTARTHPLAFFASNYEPRLERLERAFQCYYSVRLHERLFFFREITITSSSHPQFNIHTQVLCIFSVFFLVDTFSGKTKKSFH